MSHAFWCLTLKKLSVNRGLKLRVQIAEPFTTCVGCVTFKKLCVNSIAEPFTTYVGCVTFKKLLSVNSVVEPCTTYVACVTFKKLSVNSIVEPFTTCVGCVV